MAPEHQGDNLVPSSLTLFPLSGLEGLPVLTGVCVCVRPPEIQVLDREFGLDDARGLHAGPQHVLLVGEVPGGRDPVQLVQVAAGTAGSRWGGAGDVPVPAGGAMPAPGDSWAFKGCLGLGLGEGRGSNPHPEGHSETAAGHRWP